MTVHIGFVKPMLKVLDICKAIAFPSRFVLKKLLPQFLFIELLWELM